MSKSFRCEECGLVCKTQRNLSKHAQTSSHQALRCSLCADSFQFIRDLNNHLMVTHKRTAYQCVHCDKYYATGAQLANHLKSGICLRKSMQSKASRVSIDSTEPPSDESLPGESAEEESNNTSSIATFESDCHNSTEQNLQLPSNSGDDTHVIEEASNSSNHLSNDSQEDQSMRASTPIQDERNQKQQSNNPPDISNIIHHNNEQSQSNVISQNPIAENCVTNSTGYVYIQSRNNTMEMVKLAPVSNMVNIGGPQLTLQPYSMYYPQQNTSTQQLGGPKYRCGHCPDFTGFTHDEVDEHFRQRHLAFYHCKICSLPFGDITSIRKHFSTHYFLDL